MNKGSRPKCENHLVVGVSYLFDNTIPLRQIDWDKEDGVEANEKNSNEVEEASSSPGAQFAAQAAATTAASLDLPPPPHQTFDEAERLESLKDLPPGLWDKQEFVAGTYGVGGTGGADGQVARIKDTFVDFFFLCVPLWQAP